MKKASEIILASALAGLYGVQAYIWTDLKADIRALRDEVNRSQQVVAAVAAWAASRGYRGPLQGG